MQLKASELCEILDGQLEGNANAVIERVSKIEEGDHVSLSFLANPKYESHIYDTDSAVVLVSEDFKPEKELKTTLIRVKDPYSAFTLILSKFFDAVLHKKGIEQPSYIDEHAKLGKDLYVGAFAYIGVNASIGDNVKIYPNAYVGDNAIIGDNTILYAGVRVYSGCVVGSDCIIHSGTVIGSDGFGFAPQKDGSYKKIPQTGNVVIEDHVEIGANCSIDRATMGSTLIKKGVKLDNLIQIAHNVEIGENTVIAALTGVSGSTKLGKQNVVGGQVGFAGHLVIADGSQFGAQSGILGNIKEPYKAWMGSPAGELKEHLKAQAVFRNLPKLDKQVADLRRELAQIVETLNNKETNS